MTDHIYIGDGAYVHFKHADVVVTTSNGYRSTNTIVLEPNVFRCLLANCAKQPHLLAIIQQIVSKP